MSFNSHINSFSCSPRYRHTKIEFDREVILNTLLCRVNKKGTVQSTFF